MSFPRYPEHKDSGVEWLGEVPEHWGVKRIGYYFNERREKVSDKDFPALSVTKNGIVPQLDTAAKSDDGDNRKKVSKGDFVINSRSDRKGSSGASELEGSVSLICTVLRPQEHVHMPFVHHLLRSQPFQEEFYRYGKGIVADLWSTNYSEMRNILLGMPPLPEQTQIAAFLDRETAKIDELVAEQRRLMELLKEKRQAVISHAVTQGLNPHAPMKPSGIEWLGGVPEHWQVVPLRWAAKCCSGDGLSSTEVESIGDDEHCIRVIGGNGLMGYADQKNVDHSVLAVGRVGALCGNVHIVHPPAWITDNALVLDPNPSIFDLQFLSLVLRSRNLNDIASKTAQPLITGTQVSDQRIPCPPLVEQQEIASHLIQESAKFNTLTTEAQCAIDLLQERRTALISAAVTGKIDVRETA